MLASSTLAKRRQLGSYLDNRHSRMAVIGGSQWRLWPKCAQLNHALQGLCGTRGWVERTAGLTIIQP